MQGIILYSDKDYIYEYCNISYEINQVSPLLELKRFELIKQIKDDCSEYLNIYQIDINNILPRWIMLQFSSNVKSYYIDPLLPYNGLDNTQLKKDIKNLSNKKLNNTEINKLIANLNLTERFNIAIEELRLYIQSDYYINNIDNFIINVTSDNDFYYYELISSNNKKYKIHKTIINKLIKQYIYGKFDDTFFNKIIMCLILRYNTLESYNQQLAVLPEFYDYLNEKYKVNFELFASSFNSHFKNYCSLFYDIEHNLNSRGYFNVIDIKKGFYTANPPFDELIMKNMAVKLIKSLQDTKYELSILITIPAWDNPTYGRYEVLELLKESGYVQYITRIEKSRAKFFDYYENKFKYPCDIYIILIQNHKGVKKYNLTNFGSIINKFFGK